MTLTRSMCAKLAIQPAAEEMFQTPQKTMEMTLTASPRSLPTPPTAQRFICHLCRKVGTRDSDFSSNVSLSKFNDFTEHVNRKFSELELQCENLSDQINTIVQSIISHKKIINELELEIADLIIPLLLHITHLNIVIVMRALLSPSIILSKIASVFLATKIQF